MFCEICGKEVDENAVACPNCGCLVKGQLEAEQKTPQTDITEKMKKMFSLFFVLTVGTVGLSLVFSDVLPIFNNINRFQGYVEYMRWLTYVAYLPAFIMGLCGLGFGITAFVYGCKYKGGMKLASIFLFVVSAVRCFTTFIAFKNYMMFF